MTNLQIILLLTLLSGIKLLFIVSNPSNLSFRGYRNVDGTTIDNSHIETFLAASITAGDQSAQVNLSESPNTSTYYSRLVSRKTLIDEIPAVASTSTQSSSKLYQYYQWTDSSHVTDTIDLTGDGVVSFDRPTDLDSLHRHGNVYHAVDSCLADTASYRDSKNHIFPMNRPLLASEKLRGMKSQR